MKSTEELTDSDELICVSLADLVQEVLGKAAKRAGGTSEAFYSIDGLISDQWKELKNARRYRSNEFLDLIKKVQGIKLH